jgi:hypothetical protein
VLFINGPSKAFLVPDSCTCRATERNDRSYVVFICSLVALYNIDRSYVVFICSESGTKNALLGPLINNTEVYLTPFSTQNHTIGG